MQGNIKHISSKNNVVQKISPENSLAPNQEYTRMDTMTIVVLALLQRNSIRPTVACSQLSFFLLLPTFQTVPLSAAWLFFGDYGNFFASGTFTWYHHCSQHWSGYGQPEAMVK